MDVANPLQYGLTMMEIIVVLLSLDRYQEAYGMATDLAAFAKAKFGMTYPLTLNAMNSYAFACARLGRIEEAEGNFEDTITT